MTDRIDVLLVGADRVPTRRADAVDGRDRDRVPVPERTGPCTEQPTGNVGEPAGAAVGSVTPLPLVELPGAELPGVATAPVDRAAEAELVRDHLPLVAHEVRDVLGRVPAHVSRDELSSAGMLALVQAARGFDPTRGVPFAAFARRRIRGAVLDELREMDWASRSVRRRAREIDQVRERLAGAAGRAPSATEVAAASGLTTAELARHDSDLARASVGSLHDVPDDALGGLPGTRPVEPDAVLLHRERTAYLHDAVAALPERLRVVVENYFIGDRPMAQIAAELGVTESRVSQMRAEALVLMRSALNVAFGTGAPVRPAAGSRPGVAARRRAEYVEKVCAASRPAERLTYVAATELSRSA